MAQREKIQANFGAARKGRSPQESAGTLVGVREDEKNDQLQKRLVIDIGGGAATSTKTHQFRPFRSSLIAADRPVSVLLRRSAWPSL